MILKPYLEPTFCLPYSWHLVHGFLGAMDTLSCSQCAVFHYGHGNSGDGHFYINLAYFIVTFFIPLVVIVFTFIALFMQVQMKLYFGVYQGIFQIFSEWKG